MYMSIIDEIVGPGAKLALNRPQALNSLTHDMLETISRKLAAWQDDESVRAVILTGAGRVFCAGADLKGLLAGEQLEAGREDFLDIVLRVVNELRNFPKPVIAAVN